MVWGTAAAVPGVAVISKVTIAAVTENRRNKTAAESLTIPRQAGRVEADPAAVVRMHLSLPGGGRVLMTAIACSCQPSNPNGVTGTGMTGVAVTATQVAETEVEAGETNVAHPAGSLRIVHTVTGIMTTDTTAAMISTIVAAIEAMVEDRTEATIVGMTGAMTVMAEGTSVGTNAGSPTAPVGLTDEFWTRFGGATPWMIELLKRSNERHGRPRRRSLPSSSHDKRAKRIIRLW